MAKTRRTTRHVEPVRITTAPQSHRDDLDRRRRRYVASMTLRSLCFVGAVVAQTAFGLSWLMWVLIVGAVVLPYVAVVVANSQAPRIEGADLQAPGQGYRELG